MIDYRSVLSLMGTVLIGLSVTLLIPLTIAIFTASDIAVFFVTIVIFLVIGSLCAGFKEAPEIGIREGFLFVMLTWLVVAIMGAIPYVLAGRGTVALPVNAFFESMSGFTTTGATVMDKISLEFHSPAIMMWRQLTQWLGGMGIIVLAVAILPKLAVGGSQVIEAEAPGPSVERLEPRIVGTAQKLWIIYVGLTLLLVILLFSINIIGLDPKMNLYNAFAHAFSTMPTGGFSPLANGVAEFSPAVQWTIIPFMFLAGTNFALIWWVLNGDFSALKNREFIFYSVIILTGAVLVVVAIGSVMDLDLLETIRHSLFQTLSIITTTGFASADFTLWPGFALTIIFLLMFVGGCAGSTGGGIKVVRWYVGLKSIFRQLFTTVHPDAIKPLHMGAKIIEEDVISNIMTMILAYFSIFLLGTLFLQLDAFRVGHEFQSIELMSAVAATLGNIGPALGSFGPFNNYLELSRIGRFICTLLMWLGRLEIFTVLIVFTPAYWKR